MPKKLEDMVQAIKAQLKKENPKMDEEELDAKAWAIAQDRFKKMKGKEKLDEDGCIIVAENVKVILNSNIASTGNIIEE